MSGEDRHMSGIPDDILELGRQAFAQLAATEAAHHPLGPGAIARHAPGSDGARGLVLVLDVDRRENLCEIALLHSDVSLATENDLVIFSDETELGFHLVAQTDVRSSTYTQYLEAVVGMAPAELVEALTQPGNTALQWRRGMQLKGPLDARWDFKIAEVRRLHRLVHDFIHDLLHDKLLAEFDDGLIAALGANDVRSRGLFRTLAVALTSTDIDLQVNHEQLQLLIESGLGDEATWKRGDQRLGSALFDVIRSRPGFGGIRHVSDNNSVIVAAGATGPELVERA